MVDGRDRRIMQAGIEKYHADADLDGNGVVDDGDEALLQSMLNKPPGPGAGVLGRYYYYQNDREYLEQYNRLENANSGRH